MANMVGNVSERLGRWQAWFASGEKKQFFERTIEWMLALAWPIVAYNAVFRYGWKSDYYSKWSESWFALALLIPMVAPTVLRLFSGDGMELQKRLTLGAVMAVGVALAIKFRPIFGGTSFWGFFAPMALYAVTGFLWFHWRNKKSLPVKQPRERTAAARGDTDHSKRS